MTCVTLLQKRAKGCSSSMHSQAGGFQCFHQTHPPALDDEDLKILEKFAVVMYDRSSTAEEVDDARLDMFARK